MVLEVALAVGGAFLSSFLSVLFEKMASPQFLNLLKQQKLKRDLWQNLEILLLTVDKVLADAEDKQIKNPSVRKWLDMLKDAAYDAEDLLDAIATEDKRGRLDRDKKVQFNARLEHLHQKLKDIAAQKDALSLKESYGGRPVPRLPTTSLVDESEVCFREDVKDQILDFLVSVAKDEDKVPVVAIEGMGGIGKTTLAQFLFNDERVKSYFDLRTWAYVSEEFDVFKVTKTIFESIILWHCNISDLNALQLVLGKRLMGRRFLLVLDDVWNESFVDWDLLRRPFQDGAPGSKIIVTTRSQNVSFTMRSVLVHHLQPLPDEDCWSLFAKHAFKNKGSGEDPTLKAIGKKIVEKCKGLPLAAKTLGGLLRYKVEAEDWYNVLNSKIWDLPNEKSSILPALRLSYYHLPSHLKRSFAYCSIYPKGLEFEKGNLVRLWIAEGLVLQPNGQRRMEDVGGQYFDELLSRSLFQQSSCNNSCFEMHDLVNDLAQDVAGEFCFKFEDGSLPHRPERVRHLSCIPKQDEAPEKFEAFYGVFKSLRTFLPLRLSNSGKVFLNPIVLKNLFPVSGCLRVLSLSPYHVTKLPDSISNLKHLRYLDLSHTDIQNLPEGVGSLYNLETLNLSHCHSLTQLPANTGNLTKLEHLDIRGTAVTEMPENFGNLKCLQFLSGFFVSRNSESRISELKDLSLLFGTLSILGLQNVFQPEDASKANLKDKKYLNELILKWATYDTHNATEVLEKLCPHENLKKLHIERFGGTRLPEWLGDALFSKVESLQLVDCGNCSSLPSLGQLPSLKELHIVRMKVVQEVGDEFYGNDVLPFKSLETLLFRGMLDWQRWLPFKDGAFPSLQQLIVHKCPKLTGCLPSLLPSLVTLDIYECKKLEFLHPNGTNQYSALERLYIRKSCEDLISLPLGSLTKLRKIKLLDCKFLRSVGMPLDCHEDLKFLRKLKIKNCDDLGTFDARGLSSLQKLKIVHCSNLFTFGEGGLPSSLQSISIRNCKNLPPQETWGLEGMGSLRHCEVN
ncbi:NB-ARC domain-containing disease resistance protein, putative [Theobroma cacao]|uniref:NB-ARC domain-containing disease resistance protein, putative n=1 Tax=Theobroma cacao TaxID=3641 RepID=A0A061FSU5_THECC|nr:NB-ARC domain-containing disease resistance protein, putative [Theobroma cacao]